MRKGAGMFVIGIGGASGAGKTTAAGMLAAALADLTFTAKLDTFGQPAREQLRQTVADFDDKEKYRRHLQDEIAEILRDDPQHLVYELMFRNGFFAPMMAAARENRYPADVLIVHDVRRQNEARFCRRHGVMVVIEGSRQPLSGAVAEHEAESHTAEIFEPGDFLVPELPDLDCLAVFIKNLAIDIKDLTENFTRSVE